MSELPKILKLEPRGESFSANISTLEDDLIIPAELVIKHRLKAGIVITVAQVDQLREEAARVVCEATAARLLAARAHSAGELRAKLKSRSFSPDNIDSTIKDFRNRALLDDAQVAGKLVEESLKRNPSGRAHLMAMLMRKRISRELAEDTIRRYLADSDEADLAEQSLRKRWSSFSRFELERARTKAYNYLSRRGIGYAAARTAFERLYNDQNEECED
ncbi:MAG: RecX family transcriptional regulator [candidate division Zixibacteria bacterium]